MYVFRPVHRGCTRFILIFFKFYSFFCSIFYSYFILIYAQKNIHSFILSLFSKIPFWYSIFYYCFSCNFSSYKYSFLFLFEKDILYSQLFLFLFRFFLLLNSILFLKFINKNAHFHTCWFSIILCLFFFNSFFILFYSFCSYFIILRIHLPPPVQFPHTLQNDTAKCKSLKMINTFTLVARQGDLVVDYSFADKSVL